ncbi:hypothetical protein Q8F55_007686 [Vanrija albida]|uniref:HMG box domain-containing protein n=1 Tax=Vanrija albida TaxID=181172 RepID=A0ABR3PU79_9TREE
MAMSIPNNGGPSNARLYTSATPTSLSAPSPVVPIHNLAATGYNNQQQQQQLSQSPSRPPFMRSSQTYSAIPVQLANNNLYMPNMSPPTHSFGHGYSSSYDGGIPPSLDVGGHDTSVTTTPTSIEAEPESYHLYATSLSSGDESYLDDRPRLPVSRAPMFYHQGVTVDQHYLHSTSMTPSLSADTVSGVRVKPPRPPNAWIIYRSDKLKDFEAIHTREQLKELLEQANMMDQFPKYLTSIASVEKAHRLEAESNGAKRKGKKPSKPAVEGRGIFRLGKGGKGLPQAEISQLISRLWKGEPAAVRSQYEHKAEVAKQEHLQKYPGYKFQPVRKEEKAAMKMVKQAERDRKKAEKELAAGNRVRRSTGPRLSRPSPISTEERRPRSQGQSYQLERAATHPGYVTVQQIHPQMVPLDGSWYPSTQGVPSQFSYTTQPYNPNYSVASAPVPLPASTINPMATGLNRQFPPQPQAPAPLDGYVPAPTANTLVPAETWTGAPPPDVRALYDPDGRLEMAHVVPPPDTVQAYTFDIPQDELAAIDVNTVLTEQEKAGDVDPVGCVKMWAVEVQSPEGEGASPAAPVSEPAFLDPSLSWEDMNGGGYFGAPGQFPTPADLVNSDWAAVQGMSYPVPQSGLVPGSTPQMATGATGRETTGLGPTLSGHQLSPLEDYFPANSTLSRPNGSAAPAQLMGPPTGTTVDDLAPRYVSGSAFPPVIGVDDHLSDWNTTHYDDGGLSSELVAGPDYSGDSLLSFGMPPSPPPATGGAFKRPPPRVRTPGATYFAA